MDSEACPPHLKKPRYDAAECNDKPLLLLHCTVGIIKQGLRHRCEKSLTAACNCPDAEIVHSKECTHASRGFLFSAHIALKLAYPLELSLAGRLVSLLLLLGGYLLLPPRYVEAPGHLHHEGQIRCRRVETSGRATGWTEQGPGKTAFCK